MDMTSLTDDSMQLTHLVIFVQCAIYGFVFQNVLAILASMTYTETSTNEATQRHSHRNEERHGVLQYYRFEESQTHDGR